MTEDERKRYEKMILDHHSAAIKSSRAISDALDRLIPHLQAIADDMDESKKARDAAIEEMLAANAAALKLYNDHERG